MDIVNYINYGLGLSTKLFVKCYICTMQERDFDLQDLNFERHQPVQKEPPKIVTFAPKPPVITEPLNNELSQVETHYVRDKIYGAVIGAVVGGGVIWVGQEIVWGLDVTSRDSLSVNQIFQYVAVGYTIAGCYLGWEVGRGWSGEASQRELEEKAKKENSKLK